MLNASSKSEVTVAFDSRDGVSVIALVGRLDSNNSTDTEKRFLEAIGSGVPSLVIDMSGLEYISSAGLRVLLITAKKMRQTGGRFALANMRPQIAEVMQVSGFNTIIPSAATLEAALALVKVG